MERSLVLRPKLFLSLAVFCLALMPSLSFAQCPGSPPAGIDCVGTSATKEITAHTTCKSITNNHTSGKALQIPIKTSTEWSSFYSHPPTGVTVGACAGADPCSGKSIGQACAGTTALYAGVFDGGNYMIMPSGCADDPRDPTCSGTDTVTKTWNDGGFNWYDFPTISNIGAASTASSSSERGHVTTPIIAAITDVNNGGVHAAAKYCDGMSYGGYSDWYLPSKSEAAYIYCKSTPNSHFSSLPQENANCGGAGVSNQLSGFAMGLYWVASENASTHAWQQDFSTGNQTNGSKHMTGYVRCVRRY